MTSFAPEHKGLLPRAVATADMQKAEDLFHSGVDANDRDTQHGWTGLIWAALLARADFANLLLNHGADINLRSSENGWTALMFAAYHGNDGMVRLLVEREADLSLKNHEGQTAQEMAQQRGHADVAGYLQNIVEAPQRRERQEEKFRRLKEQAAKAKLKLGPGL